jgi:hypothetical protein
MKPPANRGGFIEVLAYFLIVMSAPEGELAPAVCMTTAASPSGRSLGSVTFS